MSAVRKAKGYLGPGSRCECGGTLTYHFTQEGKAQRVRLKCGRCKAVYEANGEKA